jgi:hypothetical protein
LSDIEWLELNGFVESSDHCIYSPKLLARWAVDINVRKAIDDRRMLGYLLVQDEDAGAVPPDLNTSALVVQDIRYDNGKFKVDVLVKKDYAPIDMLEWWKRDLVEFIPVFTGSVDEHGIVGASAQLVRIDLRLLTDGKHGSPPSGLPSKYVPKSLRPVFPVIGPVRYAIGIEYAGTSLGFIDGPFQSLQEALDAVPEWAEAGKSVVLVKQTLIDRSAPKQETLYRWVNGAWVQV